MAVMGFRLAQRANGVSQLHGQVSREHVQRPVAGLRRGRGADRLDHQRRARADAGWPARCSTSPPRRAPTPRSDDVETPSGPPSTRCPATRSGRSSGSCASGSSSTPAAGWPSPGSSAAPPRPSSSWIDDALDPDVLTIGFARRAASYKRLTLMMRDPERLKRLLLHPERPIQLVIAGKAHPADDGGKKLIQDIVKLSDDPEIRHRIVFLPNYDIAMAQPLYPGCDVWLNNPLRPYEACGTSGMKAALNGGLNLSVLDGWWDEWYDGDNGWAIPTADGVEDVDKRDDLEADGALRPDRERRRAAVLRPRPGGRPDPLAGDGAAHAQVARPQGAGHPDGPRLRPRALRAGRRQRPAAQLRLRRRRQAGRLEEAGQGGLAVGPGRARREQRRRRRRRGRRRAQRPRVRLARRPDARRRPRPGRRTARSTATTCSPTSRSATWPWPRPTTAAATASTATSCSTAAARSATRSG